MIKTSLKNFWKNLIYVFISMGILYLILLLVLFFAFISIGKEAGNALKSVSDVIQASSQESSASVNQFLLYSFEKINWDNGVYEGLKQMLSTNWLESTIKGFFQTLNESTGGFDKQIHAIMVEFKNNLKAVLSVSIVFMCLGLFLANFATKFAIRRRSARKDFKKHILALTIVPIMQILVIILGLFLASLIKYYSVLVVLFLLILLGMLSMFSSWIVHRDENIKLKDVLTFKNVFFQFLAASIILLINVVVIVVLSFINPIFAILVFIPFFIYSLNIIDVNTDAYILSLVENH